MKTSQFFLSTIKESPADAQLASHQLMIRAGLIRQLASGIYNFLPLGLRVLQKVESIVREEMNKSGALELLMPMVQPAELWKESDRWEKYGPELLRFHDRHDHLCCLGPTHEEVITDLMRDIVKSYKELPLIVYQIQTKFRDEIRPRFGVMRAREFLMKDAYSFDLDKQGMQASYEKMISVYHKIFRRLGLKYRATLADTGAIGGEYSHEFQALADVGEDVIVYSDESDYAANLEKAEALAPNPSQRPKSVTAMQKVRLNKKVLSNLQLDLKKQLKIEIVKGVNSSWVAVICRADHDFNWFKVDRLPEILSPLERIDSDAIDKTLHVSADSLSPLDLNMPYIVDREAACLVDFICPSSEPDYYWDYVNWERDLTLDRVADIRNVKEGDRSPDGNGRLHFARGIEVGHAFQLGDRYSQTMQAKVLNQQGKKISFQMGCYGIGVSRILAALIEQNHDERGICWPETVAPFQVALVPIALHRSTQVRAACEKIYSLFKQDNIEILWDDRPERPGVMFSDMDLIGIPHRLTVSERALQAGQIEYKSRNSDKTEFLPLSNILEAFNHLKDKA